jgi:hypothetical protein
MKTNIDLSGETNARLVELQVRFREKGAVKRLTQSQAIAKCVEIASDAPPKTPCISCGSPVFGVGFCSRSCYDEFLKP